MVVFLACLLPAAVTARADVLTLAHGGKLNGSLEEITIVVDGKPVRHARDDVDEVRVAEQGADSVRLRDGTELRGKVASVRFRTVAGALAFKREDVRTLRVVGDPQADLRKELAARRAKLKPGDAAGLLDLARWCRKNRLKREAVELARAALEAKPEAKLADEVHRFLGHVEYRGRWMTEAELLKRKAEHPEPDPPADDPDDKDLSPEERKALKACAEKNAELLRAYLERAEEKKKEEYALVRERYEEQVDEAARLVKERLVEIQSRRRARVLEKQRYRQELLAQRVGVVEVERRVNDWENRTRPAYERDLRRLKGEAQKAKAEWDRLAAIVKALQAKVARRSDDRKDRLKKAHAQVAAALRKGKPLSLNEMMDVYEALYKGD
jgi:hypothetical protein